MPEIESVMLKVDIHRRGDRICLFVMQTPGVLWDLLPRDAKLLDADYVHNLHYVKSWSVRYRRRLYEITFYRTVRS